MTTSEARHKNKKKLTRAGKLGRDGRHDEAEAIWREHLKTAPDDPDVNFNVGVCVMRKADKPADRLEAAEFFHRVISSEESTMERKADAMNNIGLMMERVGETEKAATSYAFALKMFPDHRAARVNLGDCKRFFGDYEGAAREYDAVLDQDPESPEAHFCSGMIALLLGDYRRGFDEYRWRWKAPSFNSKPFATDRPAWNGEPLTGKTIAVTAEQGWGDQVQFARYAAELKRSHPGCRVLYRCDPSMHRLFGGVYGLDGVFGPDDDAPPFDYHCPIMDVPHYVGATLDNIPPAHCIRPMPDWPVWKMQATLNRRRIGLVWAGSPTHGKDRARSIAAESYQPIIDAHPSTDFYSLQAGPRQPEVAKLSRVTDLAPQITNWTDTAQMLACMDLLISVDTACVHLAGAMGVPVFMLTPHSPDWRWLLTREDSPWYPKLRLFRQPTKYDWQTPLQRINDAL